jgi:hypothetical protein
VNDDALIAVDRHKAHNTVAVLDPVTKTAVDGAEFANSHSGYAEMMRFARRWRGRRWAIEGCHGAGRSVAQHLVTKGEAVVDVPAKLAARVRVFSQGHGRKTDRDDAISIGLAALDAAGVRAVDPDDSLVALRLLCDRREELVSARTQAVCRLHRLLAELTGPAVLVGRTHRASRRRRPGSLRRRPGRRPRRGSAARQVRLTGSASPVAPGRGALRATFVPL